MHRAYAFASLLIALLLCPALVLADAPKSGVLVLHLDFSDSVRDSLRAGRITTVMLAGSSAEGKRFTVNTTSAMVPVGDIGPGTWTIRTFLKMGGTLYAVSAGMNIDVPSGPRFETLIPIRPVILAGSVTLSGQPLHGQISVYPSEFKPGKSWGFAVPFDGQGRFAFPLPQAGNWDLTVWSSPITSVAKLHDVAFQERDALREIKITLPEATVTRLAR
jgi:hypothetical protein